MRRDEPPMRLWRPRSPAILLPLLTTALVLFAAPTLTGSPRAETAGEPRGAAGIQPRAHAHNDYVHERPLLDALSFGFCSFEADIWLVDGELLVAHDRGGVDPARTLDRLYLRPLWERFQANGGRIHTEPAAFTLLIDIKSDGAETFGVLDRKLAEYAPMLTHFTDDATTAGAVTVVISGNRATDVILASSPRRAGIDGRLSDLEGPLNRHQMPLVSDNWTQHFGWMGRGDMPADEVSKLEAVVAKAHQRGMRIRFWNIPQTEAVWSRLYDAGVDLLNADDLGRLAALLLKKRGN
jgi:hypothetical protein